MSKWFNAACDRRRPASSVLLAAALVIACQPGQKQQAGPGGIGKSKTVTAADTRVDAVPTSEPGYAERVWRAQNPIAREITGNLSGATLQAGRGSPLTLAFANGITLRLEQVNLFSGEAVSYAGGPSYVQVLGADPAAQVYVYRVTEERLAPVAQGRGVCAPRRVTFLAVSEFVDGDNAWTMRVAAYGGAQSPDPTSPDPGLCAVFAYGAT